MDTQIGKGEGVEPLPKTVGGAMRLEASRDYQRGYTQGHWDATQNLVKMAEALRNPPPILIDASNIDPKFLASLGAPAVPEAEGALVAELVRAAFEEGVQVGVEEGLYLSGPTPGGFPKDPTPIDRLWEESEARAALSKAKAGDQ